MSHNYKWYLRLISNNLIKLLEMIQKVFFFKDYLVEPHQKGK